MTPNRSAPTGPPSALLAPGMHYLAPAARASDPHFGWGDVSCTTPGDECCVLLDLAREGIGWDSGSYEPVADARYITLGPTRWHNPFSEVEDVWGWADDQLAGFNASITPPECNDTECQLATGCPTDNGCEYDGRGG